jgi:isopenicillin N synthase-like dioxygenase
MHPTDPSSALPVIDLAPVVADEITGKRAVARAVHAALHEVGFMYVTHAGLAQATRDRFFAAMAGFFARPAPEKEALAWTTPAANRGYVGPGRQALDPNRPGDLKEAFDTGWELDATEGERARQQINRWPEDDPAFRETVLTFYRAALEAAFRVLATLEAALDLTPGSFVGTHQHHNHTLRLLHYPPLASHPPEPLQIRAGAHTDFGTLTLLFQDGLGGLELRRRDGTWIAAPSRADAILVNTGDCMQRWTNDVFRSTAHRVTLPEGDSAQRSRYAAAFFCSPDPETEIRCLPSCQGPQRPPRYEPIRADQHLLNRLNETYGAVA